MPLPHIYVMLGLKITVYIHFSAAGLHSKFQMVVHINDQARVALNVYLFLPEKCNIKILDCYSKSILR